jgi:hypothetical protein
VNRQEWAIYSHSEEGWWNNDHGWVGDLFLAEHFTEEEVKEVRLPLSDDAFFVRIGRPVAEVAG